MKINSTLSNFLDISRWISAFVVVISHLRNLVFVDYDYVDSKSILIRLFYFLTGFGQQAVVIFFVLSGFLIGGSILNKIKSRNFSFTKYSIDRFSRIYMVFPLSLLSGLLFDWIGYLHFNQTGVYTNKLQLATVNFNISERIGLDTFIANFFMLQNVSTYPLGSNGPLWSLANEWWYYLYFPLIILSFSYKSTYKQAICVIAVIGLSIMMYNSNEHGNMLFSFSIWIIGTCLWFAEFIKIKYLNFYILLFLMFLHLTISRIGVLNYLDGFQSNIILAILFALIIKSIIQSDKYSTTHINNHKFNNFMASFSYSLYLTHLPLSIFLMAILSNLRICEFKMQPSFLTYLVFFLCLSSAYFYAFIFSLITEKNTFFLRTSVYKFFNISD